MAFSFAQYGLYLQYLGAALLMTVLFAVVYERITPMHEWKWIAQGNIACALSFGGAVAGFCLALASAMVHSVGFANFIVWGLVAASVQIILFAIGCRALPRLPKELEANNLAVGLFLGLWAIAVGILNAASLVDG